MDTDCDTSARQLVPTILAEYGALTRTRFAQYLPDREPRRYLYDLVSDYPSRGGRMMRSGICIATTCAFGGTIDQALGPAVAIELLHNSFLVLDDIEDESNERRGRPTLHAQHGVPLALNAGATLSLLSIRPLLESLDHLGTEVARLILEDTERVALESAEGQAMELGWRNENLIELNDRSYLEMVLKKTSWLAAIYPLRVGGLIGSRGGTDPDIFIPFGFLLGAAFQIQDDLLNFCSNERYGKERDGDLWEGKRSLPLIHLMRECTSTERQRLVQILACARSDKSPDDVAWIRSRLEKYACIDYARHVAQAIAGAASEECETVLATLPDSRDKRFLLSLPRWVIERN